MNDKIHKEVLEKVDGELKLEVTGEINSMDGRETYVMRNGQLVKGKAEKREQTDHSNWHAGNADPEDLRKHRELMDRMNFKGPQWEDK